MNAYGGVDGQKSQRELSEVDCNRLIPGARGVADSGSRGATDGLDRRAGEEHLARRYVRLAHALARRRARSQVEFDGAALEALTREIGSFDPARG